ncbi:MAG: spondin domain-containing protein [Chromatiales bacterium]|nr:spondin domain-containing protein [Chromatiales bacterium]
MANSAGAREITVEITNISNAIYFTPLLVAAHDRDTHLFQLGQPASDALRLMAEEGDNSELVQQIETVEGVFDANPAGGLLEPGASATAELELDGKRTSRLSITAMLLPTNDGFVGLDSFRIPRRSGTHTVFLRSYDAGTEANDELITGSGAPGVPGIPADPGGNSGTGGTGLAGPDVNDTVHVHRNNVGDLDPTGGPSDLDAGIHRWSDPIARVVITVEKRDDDDDEDDDDDNGNDD